MQRRHVVTLGAFLLAISLGVLMTLLASAPASASKPLLQMVYRGEYASVSWYEDLGDGAYREGYVSVGRSEGRMGGEAGPLYIYLFYSIAEGNWGTGDWALVAAGSGPIPDGDFIVGGKTASLNTDTSTNPDFYVDVGPTGTITVTWEKTHASWSHNNGRWEDHYGNIVSRGMGQYTSVSASAQGTVVGHNVAIEQDASISENHGVTIWIEYAAPP